MTMITAGYGAELPSIFRHDISAGSAVRSTNHRIRPADCTHAAGRCSPASTRARVGHYARGCIRSGLDGMNVLDRHPRMCQERATGRPAVAALILHGHEALVAEEPASPLPRNPRPVGRLDQKLIEALWRRSAGETDRDSLVRRRGDEVAERPRRRARKDLRIRIHPKVRRREAQENRLHAADIGAFSQRASNTCERYVPHQSRGLADTAIYKGRQARPSRARRSSASFGPALPAG